MGTANDFIGTPGSIEELQHRLGEREDQRHREYVREWILRLAAERLAASSSEATKARTPKTGRAAKAVRKTLR